MTGLRELRPFGHTSWAAPFDDAPLRLSSAEAAPLTTGERCALAGTDVATSPARSIFSVALMIGSDASA